MGIIRLSITPSANRNSYRVAISFYILTQGSVLRPQPWAGKSQLLQSCCWNGTAMALGMAPINQTNHPTSHPSQLSTSNQSPYPTSITIINHKPITNPTSIIIITPKSITDLASIIIINHKPIALPRIHHNYQPQINHPTPHPSQLSTTNLSPNLASITSINPKPIADPTSITSINHKPIAQPYIHHKHHPQTNRQPRIHHKHQPQTNRLPRIHHKHQPQTNHCIYIHP